MFLVFVFFSVKLAGFHDMHDVSGKESRARELSCVCVCACACILLHSSTYLNWIMKQSWKIFFGRIKKVTCKSLCRDIIMYPRYERCERKQSTDMHVNHFQQDPMLCVLDHNWAVIVQSELGKY